jgi:hypothetical protein
VVDDVPVPTSSASAVWALLDDRRAAVAICVGAGAIPFVHWMVADLSRDETSQQHAWFFVIFFSAVVLTIGAGMLVVAHEAPTPGAPRAAWFVAGMAVAASVTNLVEDGLGLDQAFLVFVAELLLIQLGCVALAVTILVRERGFGRLWAAVPLATVVAILLYVELGGPLLATTWLAAALASGFRAPGTR